MNDNQCEIIFLCNHTEDDECIYFIGNDDGKCIYNIMGRYGYVCNSITAKADMVDKEQKRPVSSMKRPNKCCEIGTYECQVPMPIKGRRQDIDLCIADIVAALNAANIETVASCCGHGCQNGSICLEDGREILIKGVINGISSYNV